MPKKENHRDPSVEPKVSSGSPLGPKKCPIPEFDRELGRRRLESLPLSPSHLPIEFQNRTFFWPECAPLSFISTKVRRKAAGSPLRKSNLSNNSGRPFGEERVPSFLHLDSESDVCEKVGVPHSTERKYVQQPAIF